MVLNPFRFVLPAVTVLLGTSSWPHYYASQTTHAHRLVAFGCVSSSEGDNFALDGLCLLHSNDSTWLLSSVTSPHVRESPAIRAPAERDFTSGLGSSIPGMMLNPFRFVLPDPKLPMRDEPAEPPNGFSGPTAEPPTRTVTTAYNASGRIGQEPPAHATTDTQDVNEYAPLPACCSLPDSTEYFDRWFKVRSYREVCTSSACYPPGRGPSRQLARPRKFKCPCF
ncbi:hypothetical protein MRX96_059349 [Rhipicephalus microplus]